MRDRRSGADPLRRTAQVLLAAVLALVIAAAVAATTAGRATAASTDGGDDASTTAAPLAVTLEQSQRMAGLVEAEDERLVDIKAVVASLADQAPKVPYRVRSSGAYTLVLTARRNPYTIADLRRLAPQTFVRLDDDAFLLREHILIDPGATLSIAPETATTLRLASSGNGFVSIVNNGGRLRLLGRASAPLTVTSWDETLRQVDPDATDGRAYVRSRGQLVVRHSALSGLGFWSGRTGGLSISFPGTPQTGAELDVADREAREAGISSSERQTTLLATGDLPTDDVVEAVGAEVSDTTVEDNAFGLFVSAASGVRITNVTVKRSLVSGLVLHRNVSSAVVRQVFVEGSGLDGVVVTKGVEGTTLSQIDSRNNARDGIRVDGSPMASGPSAAGQSMRPFGGNVIATSTVSDNGRTGIRLVGGTNVRVLTNSVTGGPQGIVVDDEAQGVVVEGNQVNGAGSNGIHVRSSSGVEVRGNAVSGSPTGIRLSDAAVTVTANTVSGATLHAVTLVGAVHGSEVVGNRLAGAGTSAVDLVRSSPDAEPFLADNDTGGWAVTLTRDSLLSTITHPMTLLWIGIGLLLLLSVPLGSRRTGMPTPYPVGPLSPASIPDIEVAQQEALVAAGVLAPGPAPVPVDPRPAPDVHLPQTARQTYDEPDPYRPDLYRQNTSAQTYDEPDPYGHDRYRRDPYHPDPYHPEIHLHEPHPQDGYAQALYAPDVAPVVAPPRYDTAMLPLPAPVTAAPVVQSPQIIDLRTVEQHDADPAAREDLAAWIRRLEAER